MGMNCENEKGAVSKVQISFLEVTNKQGLNDYLRGRNDDFLTWCLQIVSS